MISNCCKNITSGQSNLTFKGRIAAAHGRFNSIQQVAPMCNPTGICTILVLFPAESLWVYQPQTSGHQPFAILVFKNWFVSVVKFKNKKSVITPNFMAIHWTIAGATTTTTVLWPFFRDHPGELVPEENFWTLWCKERLTEADKQTIRLGATPSRLTIAHLHHPLNHCWQLTGFSKWWRSATLDS